MSRAATDELRRVIRSASVNASARREKAAMTMPIVIETTPRPQPVDHDTFVDDLSAPRRPAAAGGPGVATRP
jgi:hypothetical protein